MVTNKYAKLDALITAAIQRKPTTFSALLAGEVRDECLRLDDAYVGPEWRRPGAGRYLDRRLQALRKAGLIRFDTLHGWEYIE